MKQKLQMKSQNSVNPDVSSRVVPAEKLVPGGDNLVKDVQCYELFGGIALENNAFSFFHFFHSCEL